MTLQRPHLIFGEVLNNDVADLIARVLKLNVVLNNDNYVFSHDGEVKCAISNQELGTIIGELESVSIIEELGLVGDRSYEIMLREHSPLRSRIFDDIPLIEDLENKVSYLLDEPSSSYMLFILMKFSDENMFRYLFRRVLLSTLITRMLRETEYALSPFDILKRIIRFQTLRVTSQVNYNATSFANFSNSYLFSLGYNLDLALIPVKATDDLIRSSRIRRIRDSDPDHLTAPRKYYNSDLIHYYQLGISANSPTLEFISFYHVIEHFFDYVYEEDKIDKVRDKITSESFSYKKDKDIKDLIKIITSTRNISQEPIKIVEIEALRLTLVKFIPNYQDLLDIIDEYDNGLKEYYSKNEVAFCRGSKVNLIDQSAFYVTLSSRIYAIRNSIVHSKEGEKSRFIPFKDDAALAKEVPVMRFIAEIIINASAKIM
jgi:hypothetical protein